MGDRDQEPQISELKAITSENSDIQIIKLYQNGQREREEAIQKEEARNEAFLNAEGCLLKAATTAVACPSFPYRLLYCICTAKTQEQESNMQTLSTKIHIKAASIRNVRNYFLAFWRDVSEVEQKRGQVVGLSQTNVIDGRNMACNP